MTGASKKVCDIRQLYCSICIQSSYFAVLQAEISRLQGKCSQLEAALSARDQEYRKYAEKAKEVIKNLDPRMMNGQLVVNE